MNHNSRKFVLPLAFSIAFSLMSASAFAFGNGASGGGDACEDRFQSVAQDLRSWIVAGGPAGLDLKNGAQSITVESYDAKMLEQIDKARVTCVGPGDKDYPVSINGYAKECASSIDLSGVSRIVCDRAKFYSGLTDRENNSQQYVIVHHEYATLAGLEIPDADDSHYWISNQITGFLEDQMIKKLTIKPLAKNEARVGTFRVQGPAPDSALTGVVSPDRLRLAYVHDKQVTIVNLHTLQDVTTFSIAGEGENDADPITFSPDGSEICNWSKKLNCYDTSTGIKILELGNVYKLWSFLPEGQQIVMVEKQNISFYDSHSGQLIRKLSYNSPQDLLITTAISDDGSVLFLMTGNFQVNVIDLSTGKTRFTFHSVKPSMSADGTLITGVDADDGKMTIYDAKTGRVKWSLAHFPIGGGRSFESAFLPDDSVIVAAGAPRMLSTIYTKDGQRRFSVSGNGLFAEGIDPAGNILICRNYVLSQFIVSSLKNGHPLKIFAGDIVNVVTLSKNRVLAYHADGTAEVVDIPDEQ